MPNISDKWSLVGVRNIDTVVYDRKLGTVSRSRTSYDNLVSSSGVRNRTSLQTPGYGLKKLIGKLPENYFNYGEIGRISMHGYEKTTEIYGVSDRYLRETSQVGIFPEIAYASPFGSVSAIEFNQSNLAKAKVLNKIKNSDVDLAVFAGESKETWRMFSDTAKYIANGVKAARKGDASAVRRALGITDLRNFDGVSKKSANAWLMFNYGIKPLINDLEGAVKAYEKGIIKERYLVQSTRNSYEDNRQNTFVLGGYNYHEDWSFKLDTSMRVKYEVTDGQLATITSLGLTNPMSLGWELTKLSFVVDWMVGIGDWLSSIDASLGKTYVGGSITQFTKTNMVGRRWSARKKYGAYSQFDGKAEYGWWNVSCKRTALSSWSIPYLPAFNDKLGLFHVATSVALLRQLKR